MSNPDFQDRLKRIAAIDPNPQAVTLDASRTEQISAQKPNFGLLVIGAAILALGTLLIKLAYDNYDAVRDSANFGTVIGLGLAGMVAWLIGASAIMRAAPARAKSSPSASDGARSPNGTQKFFRFLGLTLGTGACLFMFLSSAARHVDTEKAQLVSSGSFLVALLIVNASLLFGIAGLFLRGYGLGRMQIYFLSGGILTYAAVVVSGMNFLEWPSFVAIVQ